ncbi:hypothetical protein [Amycolatopsis pittospori]|nr:hypothetical protein [Amycolatopsis pittospori]
MGDGDPEKLENWFFAVWAYNSPAAPARMLDSTQTPNPNVL